MSMPTTSLSPEGLKLLERLSKGAHDLCVAQHIILKYQDPVLIERITEALDDMEVSISLMETIVRKWTT